MIGDSVSADEMSAATEVLRLLLIVRLSASRGAPNRHGQDRLRHHLFHTTTRTLSRCLANHGSATWGPAVVHPTSMSAAVDEIEAERLIRKQQKPTQDK
jgi:hypothetical protein